MGVFNDGCAKVGKLLQFGCSVLLLSSRCLLLEDKFGAVRFI